MTDAEMLAAIEAEFKKELAPGIAYPAPLQAGVTPQQPSISCHVSGETDPEEFGRRYAYPAGRVLAYSVEKRALKSVSRLESHRDGNTLVIVANGWPA